MATAESNFSSQTGSALARLALVKTFNGDSDYRGVVGGISIKSSSNSNNKHTELLGGEFNTFGDNVTLSGSSRNFWVAGARTTLSGSFNNTPNSGALAALIAIDENQGTAQSWAGYFLGKAHINNKTIIGNTSTIPSTAGDLNVSNFNLYVTGGILAEEFVVATQDMWADYVFEENYDLKSLAEIEEYITQNGYLPDFPSAESIAKKGINLAKITILQQEKIEELFLHSIELNKKNQVLEKENQMLKKQLELIEQRLLALEKAN